MVSVVELLAGRVEWQDGSSIRRRRKEWRIWKEKTRQASVNLLSIHPGINNYRQSCAHACWSPLFFENNQFRDTWNDVVCLSSLALFFPSLISSSILQFFPDVATINKGIFHFHDTKITLWKYEHKIISRESEAISFDNINVDVVYNNKLTSGIGDTGSLLISLWLYYTMEKKDKVFTTKIRKAHSLVFILNWNSAHFHFGCVGTTYACCITFNFV